jgi:predicted NUDIX family NTP pyrophosphohydrolase
VTQQSAGILLYRHTAGGLEVLLAHPGGPFHANKDAGDWSIPKGLLDDGEEPLSAAMREFAEETGVVLDGEFRDLGEIRQSNDKIVRAFAHEGDFEAGSVVSNEFEMEWPPHSGRRASFPEIDRVEWFDLPRAREKVLSGQLPLLDRLETLLASE